MIRRREGGCVGAWEGRMWVTVGRWVGRKGGEKGGGGSGRILSSGSGGGGVGGLKDRKYRKIIYNYNYRYLGV